jgi:hypothetical protein
VLWVFSIAPESSGIPENNRSKANSFQRCVWLENFEKGFGKVGAKKNQK